MRKYKFKIKNKFRFLLVLCLVLVLIMGNIAYFITYGDKILDFNNDSDYLNSAIVGNKVYINELEADYYYYKGINYTDSGSTYPTEIDKNIYNDKNLVSVKATYSSHDGAGNLGYVSLTERQDTYIYFNLYPVNNNGTVDNFNDDYIDIILIDNPFTDRPTDLGFNGWNTNYSGATITYDSVYYERHVILPVTYTGGVPDKIDITFNASWVSANIQNAGTNFDGGINLLDNAGMKKLVTEKIVYGEKDMAGYYHSKTVGRRQSIEGLYDRYGTLQHGTCNPGFFGRNCNLYSKIQSENFDMSLEYYELVNGEMSLVDNSTIKRPIISQEIVKYYDNANMSSFYRKKHVAKNASVVGLYDNKGNIQNSGKCTKNGGCNYYELIQYNNANGETEIYNKNKEYFYLVTRDTNLLYINNNIAGSWSGHQNKPMTVTGIKNHVLSNSKWNANTSVNADADLGIENVTLYYDGYVPQEVNPPDSGSWLSDADGVLFGNFHNVKIGRGLKRNGNNVSFKSIEGGGTTGTHRYKLVIESGYFNSISLSNAAKTSGWGESTVYLSNKSVYGNDYDKAKKDNTKLDVSFCASGSWGDQIYADNSDQNKVIFDLTVKSGSFGTDKHDLSTGIYVGGRYGGNHHGVRKVKIEGGYIFNLIGGPLSASNRNNLNDIYIYMIGGEVDLITGGAGTSATYGNRIIQITGGTVNYSVFGGSNGFEGNDGDGTLNGSSYIYIGGNSVIGKEEYVNNNNKMYGTEAGSVFGIGNGKAGMSAIGSCDNSTIIVADNALIRRNVYGGGNYGAVGVSSTSNSSYSKIVILDGLINGSVYGGGNNNGSGSNSHTSLVDIKMYGGNVVGSIYGGSNEEGTIFGDVTVGVYGGEVSNSVYGGGQGGISGNKKGTYVSGNVNVNIGDGNINNTPIINSSVYGGSAFGTVNGITNSADVSPKKTNVTVNKGIITNVFGGGQGNSTFIPYVLGDIKVNINGGNITNVYGGNDKSGKPNGNIDVYINNGTIASVYGGGNETGANTTNVYVNGGSSSKVFGGSNISGNVQVSNVTTTGGNVETLYGGNNQGGETGTTNVLINGGNIGTVYGGGEKTSVTTKTNVTVKTDVGNVFGGSNMSGNIPETNVNIDSGNLENVYGGNNQGGEVNTSNVYVNGGNTTNIYGGGLKANTITTNISAYNGNATNIYGGGSEAGATTTNVKLGNIKATNVYGGSNVSGNVPNSNITTIDPASIPTVSGYDNLDVTNIYGGNNLGGVTTSTNINLARGKVGNIYGGGKKAVSTTTNVNLNNVNVTDNIYGGGDEAPVDSVTLNVASSAIGSNVTPGNIYGGGNKAKVNKNIDILVNNNTEVYGNVFGGGNAGEVDGVITLNVDGSKITGNVFGGGNAAAVNNKIILNIKNNTTVTESVYGGGNLGEVFGLLNTTVSDSTISKNIYGAGNEANVTSSNNGDIIALKLINSDVLNIYGGGNAAAVTGNINTEISNTIVHENIYGGGNGIGSVVPNDATGENNLAKVNGNINTLVNNNTKVTNIYGAGNLGMVTGQVDLVLNGINVSNSTYGGGNNAIVGGSAHSLVSNCVVADSVYAGGNGTLAIVRGNTNIDIDNNTKITNHVFGGGNAAATGIAKNDNSVGIVNIAGATIGKNVYGGANTSVLYGEANVNIGKNVVTNTSLIPTDINIGGTVFGGGEANASGSEIYDFNFISVTKGINIKIDGSNHNVFDINGSIFGSGNASSAKGFSNIKIDNYGTQTNIKKNISIQRANLVTISNSYLSLSGATDRTNEYSDVLFTLSRIDELKLKNSSSLYLDTGANLVKKFTSCVDINGVETKASATIDNVAGTFSRNTNNRVYIKEGKNLNIAKNENITDYGDVSGMTFFGMYRYNRTGDIITALYGDYGYGAAIPSGDLYYFTNGSYVLGKHFVNHDITVDGFYSNYGNETDDGVIIKYIEPTPDNSSFYMWSIGEVVASYTVNLTASKYSTLGAQEVSLFNHTNPNTTFSILGVNYLDMDSNIKLINYEDIPRVARTTEEANTVFGLNMKSGPIGWLTNGSTNFISEGNSQLSGTKDYIRENYNNVPSFVFYLYHSKNLTATGSMGSVTISLAAITPIDDLNNEVERININVNLSRALYNTNDYEGTITPGKEYEMFATNPVDITSKSSFSTYYSLFSETDVSLYKPGYYRTLVSSYVFPVNTKITMIDLHDKNNPIYYYYVVNQSDYNDSLGEFNSYGETSYKFSKFIKMGSTSINNNYDDEFNNGIYYNNNICEEEFIFMVDFKDSNITEDVLDKTLLIELRNKDDQVLISVLGIEQQTLKYNLYYNSDAVVNLQGTISKNPVYSGDKTNLTIDTDFVQKKVYDRTIKDTLFDDEKLGLKISIFDSHGNLLSAQDLFGSHFIFNGSNYYPRYDGTTRIKISDKVANARSKITFDTGTSKLSSGTYKFLIESFGSYDGIYYGPESSKKLELNLNVIDTPYGLSISVPDELIFVDKTTGFTKKDSNAYYYNVGYTSQLDNPRIRIKLQRRNYDSIYTTVYNDVNLLDYVTNNFNETSKQNEYLLTSTPLNDVTYWLYFKENLMTGTYRIVLSLYDGDNYIGEVYQYLIIK